MADEQSGTRTLIQIFVNGEYRTVGGQISHSDNVSTSIIDITNPAGQRYRELFPGEGTQARDITLECVFNSDEAFLYLRQLALNIGFAQFRLVRCGSNNIENVGGIVSSFKETAATEDKLSASFTILSSGAFELGSDVSAGLPCITRPPRDRRVLSGSPLLWKTQAKNWTTAQWFRKTETDTDFVQVDGATQPNLTFASTPEEAAGQYFIRYCNALGCVDSETATLEVIINEVGISARYPVSRTELIGPPDTSLPVFLNTEVGVGYDQTDDVGVAAVTALPFFEVRDAQVEPLPTTDEVQSDTTTFIPFIEVRDVQVDYVTEDDVGVSAQTNLPTLINTEVGVPYAETDDMGLDATTSLPFIEVTTP